MKRFFTKYKQYLGISSVLFYVVFSVVSLPTIAHAYACDPQQHPGEIIQGDKQCCDSGQVLINGQCCPIDQERLSGGVISCSGTSPQCQPGVDTKAASTCLFTKYINPAIALLSAAVGVVVVIAVIYGGIEYTSSGGDPARVASGKKHIISALIGLLAYLLLFAFLQFIIPGGILNG